MPAAADGAEEEPGAREWQRDGGFPAGRYRGAAGACVVGAGPEGGDVPGVVLSLNRRFLPPRPAAHSLLARAACGGCRVLAAPVLSPRRRGGARLASDASRGPGCKSGGDSLRFQVRSAAAAAAAAGASARGVGGRKCAR